MRNLEVFPDRTAFSWIQALITIPLLPTNPRPLAGQLNWIGFISWGGGIGIASLTCRARQQIRLYPIRLQTVNCMTMNWV